jgi:cobyrinic acid a,c-diamide synthase
MGYIDVGWLSVAAGVAYKHLDLLMMGEHGVKDVFATYTPLHATGTLDWAKWLVKKAKQTGFSESM